MELHRTRGPGIGDWLTLVRKPRADPVPSGDPGRVVSGGFVKPRQVDPKMARWFAWFSFFAFLGFLAVVGIGVLTSEAIWLFIGGPLAWGGMVAGLGGVAAWSESPQRERAITAVVILGVPLGLVVVALMMLVGQYQ